MATDLKKMIEDQDKKIDDLQKQIKQISGQLSTANILLAAAWLPDIERATYSAEFDKIIKKLAIAGDTNSVANISKFLRLVSQLKG